MGGRVGGGRQRDCRRGTRPYVFLLEDPVATRQNAGGEGKDVGVGDFTAEDGEQDSVIDGKEVFDDIEAEGVGIPAGKQLETVDSAVRALAYAVGEAVGDELGFPNGRDDVTESMVDDTVGERGGADAARLGGVDGEMDVGAGKPASRVESGSYG